MGEILASESSDDKDVIRVAQDMLDRGDPATRKGNLHIHAHTHATIEDLEEVKQRARDRAASTGQLVEATIIEDDD